MSDQITEAERLIGAAEHWEALADSAESKAAWDRSIGIDLSAPGDSAGDAKAATYRRRARTLRLEAATGLPHCMCHEAPACPLANQGARV